MNKTQLQTIDYLLTYVEQATEYPLTTLETLARKINAEVVRCDIYNYKIKRGKEVLFSGMFSDVLKDLTLYILDN